MAKLFITVLNMTLTSWIVIGVVFVARYFVRNLPKLYSYLLWLAVLFRLLCPFSLRLPVSVLSPPVRCVGGVRARCRLDDELRAGDAVRFCCERR